MKFDSVYDRLAIALFGDDAFETVDGDLVQEDIMGFVKSLVQARWESQSKQWSRVLSSVTENNQSLTREFNSTH